MILSSHASRLAPACSALDLFSFSFSLPTSALITVSSDYAAPLRREKRFKRFSVTRGGFDEHQNSGRLRGRLRPNTDYRLLLISKNAPAVNESVIEEKNGWDHRAEQRGCTLSLRLHYMKEIAGD
ncbi:hypothetical protein [Paraburkholderia hiiakae]|uniref:hypothetical protein n=1 Tax=Paraburkholderia hiiakae TaxID=1081782 RepID=UPI0019183B89|nr:hypothetical protein [Paraburkholderia hiiakae]